MKNILMAVSLSVMFMFGAVGLVGAGQQTTHALNPGNSIQEGVTGAGGGSGGDDQLKDGLKDVVNILLFILGAIAVIVIVIGGLRYTLASGEQAQIKQAKDTILYAVVGLIVALLAYAIVNFVIGQF